MQFSKAKNLRDKADECRVFAEAARFPSAKRIWLEIADSYDDVALQWDELDLTKFVSETIQPARGTVRSP